METKDGNIIEETSQGRYIPSRIRRRPRPEKERNDMIHILVVEDDERLNRLVCTYLNDSGFQTKGCLNAGTHMTRCTTSYTI